MNSSCGQPKRLLGIKSSTPSNAPAANLQQPSILPDTSPDHMPSNNLMGARSFVTQTWTIPERPKPGRKPKQKSIFPNPKQPLQQPCPDSNQPLQEPVSTGGLKVVCSTDSAIKSKSPSMIELEDNQITKTNDLEISGFPGALQQLHTHLSEAEIHSSLTQQSDQSTYYKALAAQTTSKLKQVKAENNMLQSQVKVLREEVLRLRKKNCQLIKKSTAQAPLTPIAIEDEECNTNDSQSSNQVPHSGGKHAGSFEKSGHCVKKSRQQTSLNEGSGHNPDDVLLQAKTNTLPKTLSEIYLVEDSRSLASQPSSSNPNRKRIPDFTTNDINCGLCTSELDCVCRQVGLKPPLASRDLSGRDLDHGRLAVPIHRRSQPSSSNLWRLVTDSDNGSLKETSLENLVLARECNGNPEDCPACHDDPFGQAFCTALNQTNVAQESFDNVMVVSATSTSSTTVKQLPPSDPVLEAYMNIPCCGDPKLCGSQNCFEIPAPPKNAVQIPCSEAWRQLKAHPNIGLANLQLLADVVARKSTPYPLASSSASINSQPSLIDHPAHQSHHPQLSSDSNNDNEDSIFGPHLTLLTIFENVHADSNNIFQPRNSSIQTTQATSSDPLHDTFNDLSDISSYSPDSILGGSTNIICSTPRKPVKFVEQESLNQALRMLDRASNLKN